jgi:hypothetical protein
VTSMNSVLVGRDRTHRRRGRHRRFPPRRPRLDFNWEDEGRYAHLTPRTLREREFNFRKRQAAKALKLLSQDLHESIRQAAELLITSFLTARPGKKPVSRTQIAERVVHRRLGAAMRHDHLTDGIAVARAALSDAWNILKGNKVAAPAI